MSRPLQLYDIQKQFIKSARKCIKTGKIGIFSSPTGTGKTISLLLSIEKYLSQNKICDYSGLSNQNIDLLKELKYDKTPVYYASRTHSQLNQAIKELKNLDIQCDALVIGSRALYCRHEEIKRLEDVDLINERCKKVRDKDQCIFYTNLKNPTVSSADVQSKTEDEFESLIAKRVKMKSPYQSNFSLQKRMASNDKKNDLKNVTKPVADESPNVSVISYKDENDSKEKNERISRLEESLPAIKKKNFHNHGIHDIEDLKENDCNFCPYYKAKELVKSASIVFLPYQMLFSKESRESFNLELQDAIIIVDEAHNIYETVIQMNSAVVFYDQLYKYVKAFRKYRNKVEDNLVKKENTASNNFLTRRKKILDTFIDILSTLLDFCESQNEINSPSVTSSDQKHKENSESTSLDTKIISSGEKTTSAHTEFISAKTATKRPHSKSLDEKVLYVNNFLMESNLQNYNMLVLKEYLKTTNIIQILEGFEKDLHLGLYTIVNFLILLTNSDKNGLVLYDNKKIRFTPLDAQLYFEEIGVCKSLILAGGTMEPLDSLLRIFPDAEIHSYASVCNNFIANILSTSASGKKLRLTYEQRENTQILKELSITLKNLITSARSAMEKGKGHGGIVCFVPSKAFLECFKTIFTQQIDQKL
ncbi:Helicase of the DEAD superfamily, partial [Pseudoloma neurophilia]